MNMRGSIRQISALLVLFVAACSEPTGMNTSPSISPNGGISRVVLPGNGTVTIVQGNAKFAAASNFIVPDPAVQVLDGSGNPVANEPVTFTADQATARVGLGSAPATSSFTVNTNSSGVAIVRWKLGSVVTGTTLTAQVGTGGVSVVFNAIATATAAAPVIAIVGGNGGGQNLGVMAGNAVTNNPAVSVFDNNGTTPIPNVSVGFTPSGNGTVSASQAITNASGIAQVAWYLKSTSGVNTITLALVPSYGIASTSFNVTGVANGVSLSIAQGNNESRTAVAQGRFGPRDPAFQILDGTGAGVANATVKLTFGTGTSNCDPSNPTVVIATTDGSGYVRTGFCLNAAPTVGTKTLVATAGSLTATVTGTATNDNSVTTINNLQGSGQSATVGTTLSSDPTVQLVDNNSQAIAGATVTFTAGGNGSLCNLGTCGNVLTVTTDANGRAAARWTLGTTAGTQTLSVTASTGATLTPAITATANAGAAAGISKVNGDGQTSTAGTVVGPRDPGVLVVDAFGNAVAGASVVFTPSGNGSMSSNPVTTNAGGVALVRWTLSTTTGANTLTATVSGTSITTSFSATGN
jgi:hypothetical protein